jgi:putative ABC transport system substrate-binding protein
MATVRPFDGWLMPGQTPQRLTAGSDDAGPGLDAPSPEIGCAYQLRGSSMQRRAFIVGLGATITGSIQPNAQGLPSVPLVGYLDDGPAEGFVFRQVVFREGLAELDYFEGCNVAIESHYARLPYWASDLVDRGVAVLVASGSVPALLAAKAATTTIPIVFGFGADPIETGLVSSLDHPGGNITGITSMTTSMGSKRLGLLRDLLPRATRVAVLVDPNDDATVVKSMIADVRGAARSIGREIEVFYAGDVDDIDTAFAGLVAKRSEVLLVSPLPSSVAHGLYLTRARSEGQKRAWA